MLNRYQNRYRADRGPRRTATSGKRVAVIEYEEVQVDEETGAGSRHDNLHPRRRYRNHETGVSLSMISRTAGLASPGTPQAPLRRMSTKPPRWAYPWGRPLAFSKFFSGEGGSSSSPFLGRWQKGGAHQRHQDDANESGRPDHAFPQAQGT
jgi:hypothetical protein